VEDNFSMQLVSEPSRAGALLDLLFTNREGLVGDVVVGGRLGLSMVKLRGGPAKPPSWTSAGRLWPVQDAG